RLPPGPAGFVARHGESAVLTRHLEALREGRGGVVWVEGEPGIGKTALLASALAPAAARGVPVLWGTADEPTSRFPLRVLLDAVRLSEDPSPDQPDSVVRTADGLLNTVARLCAGTPLVLVVDDLHHADQASLVLWHRLTRLTARSPLLLVVATRAVPRGHALTRVRQACLRAGVTLLPVGALSPDESADLVARMVNAEPGLTLLERTRQAAGNPRYLRDVAELLLRQGSVQVEGGIAEVTRRRDRPLGPVIVRRLSFLTDGTRDLLRSATLLGREFELGELAVLTGRTVTELEPPLEEATATGLLELAGPRFAFRYEVVRTALYETMPVTLRQVLHRQAAQHFDEAGIRVERVVAQLLAADGPVDEWVIDWLLAHTATIAGSQPADTVTLLTRVVASPALRGPLRETLTARLVRLRLLLGGRPEAEARAVLATTSEESVAEEMRRVLAELARPALSDRCQNP
ncbi:AAA family ATPase, partial [Crossiella equi]|uniref:AAA family ATPase n=1 Tax=Crossiella equi TaxID=130796 RepID=UPI0013024950